MAKGKEIIRGRSAAKGIVTCTVVHVSTGKELREKKFGAGDCLVMPHPSDDNGKWHTVPEDEPFLQKAGGFIHNDEGVSSHIGIFSQRTGKPCIVLTQRAFEELKEGQRVVVDAAAGEESYSKVVDQKLYEGMRPYGAVFEHVGPLTPEEVAASHGIKGMNPAALAAFSKLAKPKK